MSPLNRQTDEPTNEERAGRIDTANEARRLAELSAKED